MRKPVVTAAAFETLPKREQEVYLDGFTGMCAWRGYDKLALPPRFYVTLRDSDAPPDLLDQLRQRGFHVEPGSRWRQGRGMNCELGSLEWLSPTLVRARGGWLYGSVGGQWGTFLFEKKDGFWRIASFTMEEIA